jgi:putative transposase
MKIEHEFKFIDLIDGEYRMIVNCEDSTIKCKFCNSTELVKNGHRKGTQYWICRECGKSFVANKALPKMKYPTDIIADAVYNYYAGSSLNQIRHSIEQKTNVLPSSSTIYEWVNKLTDIGIKETKNFQPRVGDVWIADETYMRIDKHKSNDNNVINPYSRSKKAKWIVFWDIIDADTRFLLASHVTTTRNKKDAQILMEKASKCAGKLPKVVVTDKLKAYIEGTEMAFGADSKHKQGSPFEIENNTNLIERFHSSVKSRTKVMRALKDKDTLQRFMDGWLVNYNYFRPHMSLDDKTPAEKSRIKFTFKNWLELINNESPTNRPDKKLIETTKIMGLPVRHLKPYRKRKEYKKNKISDNSNTIIRGIR